MLILPLHRVPGRSGFAWCTFALMLVNVFVFVVLQSGDERVRADALQRYVEVDLAGTEAPLYRRYLEAEGEHRRAADFAGVMQLPEPALSAVVSQHIDLDPGFRSWVESGVAFDDPQARLQWQQARADYEAVLSRSTTHRYMLRGNEIDPLRMFTAAFLHGDVAHLLGNLVFLFLIGHLVEAVLGAWRYVLLYALAALGASAAALAWRWGEPSAGLGASGAIAGLMGAYCVLWGRRKVRFFYWFFVVFDYVRAPAIWLLPAWLGWELLQMILFSDAGVGFEAHAGGLVSGAVLAFAMKHVGPGLDAGRLDLAEDVEAGRPERRLDEALQHLGRMELDAAEARLAPLVGSHPDWLPARVAHYRVARYAGWEAQARVRADAVLAIGSTRLEEVERQAEVLDDARSAGVACDPGLCLGLASRMIEAGAGAGAWRLLDVLPASRVAPDAVAAVWLRLALAFERHGSGDYREVLERLVRNFPGTVEAGKARFLLEQG